MSNISVIFIRLTAFAILASVIFKSDLYAQENNSLYFMDGIPQSNQLNPATQPRFGLYIGMPLLSSIEVNAGNSSLGISDLLSGVSFNPNGNDTLYLNKLLSRFNKNNYFSAGLSIDLLSFGFRINNSYVSFSAGDRVNFLGNIPYGVFDLLTSGNLGTDNSFNLTGMGMNLTWYREYAVGYSIEVDDHLTFGFRGKLLYGIANLSVQNSNSRITTYGPDSLWQAQANIQINSSAPALFDSMKHNKISPHQLISMLTNTQNPGAAIDMGVIYKFTNYFSVSASVVDLGFIQWHSGIHNYEVNGSYNFRGSKIDTVSSNLNLFNNLADTLKSAFAYKQNTYSYNTALYGKIYLGAYLQPAKWIGLGALSRTEIRNGVADQQYTLSLNLKPGKEFNFTLGYTIASNTYDNLGLGFYFLTGPLQWYFMSERIPLNWYSARFITNGPYYPVPYDEKNFNFHMGLNFVFGADRSTRIMKLKRDKPLVEVENKSW